MENTIFIENLHSYIDVTHLCDEFKRYGKILAANIECDSDGKPSGEGYITFKEFLSASDSVKFMNGTKKLGHSIHVTLSIEENYFKKIFIKNFSHDWDECNLLKAFEKFGEADDAKINHTESKSYGFIIFKYHFSAKNAIECMNGKMLNGQKLIVERYKSKSERENIKKYSLEYAKEMLQKSTQPNNLHIKNLPKDLKEDELKKIFEKYGEISNVKIATEQTGARRCFGFVSFTSKDNASKAQKKMNGFILENSRLEVNFKEDRNARKHYLELKNRERKMNIKHYKQTSYSMSALQFLPRPVYSVMNDF